MPLVGAWCKVWIYFGFVVGWSKGARPRFDTSTDMGLVLIPADAEIDSVIFRLRATDQDADFPLVFEVTATITPVVRIENLPCTLYNKVCQANVILTKRLTPGRLHDFAVRVRDTKGDSNSMQATISVTNATTPRDKIFPHIPSLIMVPEDTKPGKELDYLLVRANSWSGKPVYIELWQPKELFTIRQRQTPTQTRGMITLIGELDFETQSMYTLTMYATDPYTEPGKDTRNIAGLNVVVVVQDVQDVPPIFTLAPPLTKINNSVQPGDIILRVHAEDGDKGVPREITYGLVSEGNPFTPFFDISETTGEIMLARSLEELTQITHVGAPVVLTVVAEEIRRSREEPPAQATVVDVGFLLGEPGNSPPYFESDNYFTTIDENLEPGAVLVFSDPQSSRVRDEDIGKAGVFTLKLEGNNGTFEINPTVAERNADFVITVRDNTLIDYELYKTLSFKIVAQEVGPATNLSASVPVTIFLRDVNDNPPVFDEDSYEVTLSENVTAGTRVVQVHATDKDTGVLGSVRYTGLSGQGSEAFTMDPDTGLITVAMASSLDREIAEKLLLSVEARDEDGKGNRGVVPLIVHLIDVNDNAPEFEKSVYEFMLNSELTNFTTPAFIKANDADAEPPNNEVRYELVHGNYENKFHLNEITGELTLRSPITRIRRKKQSAYESYVKKSKEFVGHADTRRNSTVKAVIATNSTLKERDSNITDILEVNGTSNNRTKRGSNDPLYTLTARAYDLGVPHLSSVTEIRVLGGAAMEARIMMFVVPGEHPDSTKTAEALAAITGGRVTVLETRPYVPPRNQTGGGGTTTGSSNKTIVVARVEQTDIGTALVDVEKIRDTLAASGVGIINGTETVTETPMNGGGDGKQTPASGGQTTNTTIAPGIVTNIYNEEVVVYKAENKLLFWLLIILGLLMIAAITALIICCICPGCPFYMAPRKRRVHSSETLIVRSDGRPKRHLHRKPIATSDATYNNGRKQAWSADPTRRNWQFNRRNIKNCGLASLPGDVAYISGHANDVQVNADSERLRDVHLYGPTGRRRMGEQEGLYVEDVEAQKGRSYDAAEMDSLQRHEIERSSEAARQSYRQRYVDAEMNEEDHSVREQHFYREGNAEVLRLVTRGQMDEMTGSHHHHYHRQPATLVIDGKDIILRRFMEDQKSRHDLSVHDMEAARSMDSHRRSQEVLQPQPEIILIPERLEVGRRQHVDELGPAVQRLIIDHGDYESHKADGKESLIKETPRRSERHESMGPATSFTTDRASAMTKDRSAPYSFHDLELAKQNVLLTRLLLERENRQVGAAAMDATSYLETQSLPGQVAIATQTDRTAATQTDRHVRSRSDNDESDEETKHRKKLKPRKRYEDSDWKRTRALWMKSPIAEEEGPYFDKRLSILRKKVKEVKEGSKRTPLEPGVLREISDSLNGNSSSNKAEDDSRQTYERSTEQTSIRYKVLNDDETGSPSSAEICKTKRQRIYSETCIEASDDTKVNGSESTSSQDAKERHEKRSPGKFGEKSPRKEGKSKGSKKSDGIVKPSFRILEKEITMLTKKLSKLGDKKVDATTISDSPSQEKSESSPPEVRKDSDHRLSRKADSRGPKDASASKILAEQGTISRKEAAIAKTRQKLKYQQTQVMSTGSSEYDDNFEKPKKQTFKASEDMSKQKSTSQQKLKRQSHVEQHEVKKQESEDQEDVDLRKSVKESQRIELQTDKPERHERHEKSAKREKLERLEKDENLEKRERPEKPARLPRPPKLTTVSRTEHIQEQSTSTSSSQGSARKAVQLGQDSDKKSSTEFSDSTSNDSDKPQSHKVPKQSAGKMIQTPTESTESQGQSLEQRETISDEKESMKAKQKKKETSTEKVGSAKKDMSSGSSTKSDKHSQDSVRRKEKSVSELEKEKHFLKELPGAAWHYAEEITTAALGIVDARNGEKDIEKVKLSDPSQPEIETLTHKQEDKDGKVTPTETEAGAEGKLVENTKDSMQLKETEKQVEDSNIDNAGKTEVTDSKEEEKEAMDFQEVAHAEEEKPIKITSIADIKEEVKNLPETIHEKIEEISGFTIHQIPKAHERIDKFEDNFSDMDVESDTKNRIKQDITQSVDKVLSIDDKRPPEETAASTIEDKPDETGIKTSESISQQIKIQSEEISDVIKQSTNGESKKFEQNEQKLQLTTPTTEQSTDPPVTSIVSEENAAESKEEDEKQQMVSDAPEEQGKQDKPGTESDVVTEVGATVKMPKSGVHENEEEPSISGAKDIEHENRRPLTPDTNMIQTATGKDGEVKTSSEPLRIVSPEIKEESSKVQVSPEQSIQSETKSLSKTMTDDEQMQPKLSIDASETQEVVGSIETETKESFQDGANEKEEQRHDIKETEKEDAIQIDMPEEQKENITVAETEQNVSKLEKDEPEKFEVEEKKDTRDSDYGEKEKDEKPVSGSIDHEKEQKDVADAIDITNQEGEQDKESAMQSTEHKQDEQDAVGTIESPKSEIQQDKTETLESPKHEEQEKDKDSTPPIIEYGKDDTIIIPSAKGESQQDKTETLESPKHEGQEQDKDITSPIIEQGKEERDNTIILPDTNDESQQDKIETSESTKHGKNEDENNATKSAELEEEDTHEEHITESPDNEIKTEIEKDPTEITEQDMKAADKTDAIEITEQETQDEEMNKTEEKSRTPTPVEVKQDAEILPPTVQGSILMSEEKVADDDISRDEKVKEQHLPQQSLGAPELPIKEEDEIKVGIDEPTKPQEDVTPSILTSPAEDQESVSRKVQEKMEDALGSPVAEEIQEIGFPRGDQDVNHLETSPYLEENQPVSLQIETEEKVIDTQGSDKMPQTEDSFLDPINRTLEETPTSDTIKMPLPEIPEELSVSEQNQSLKTKEEEDVLKQSEDKLGPEVLESEDQLLEEREIKVIEKSKDKTHETVPIKEMPADSEPPKDLKGSTPLKVELSEDRAQDSSEIKHDSKEESPKQTQSMKPSISTSDIPVKELTDADTGAKDEQDTRTESKQIATEKLEQKEPSSDTSEESSDISSGPAVLQVIPDPLIPESKLPAPDTSGQETEETTSGTMSDSTEAPEPKGQLALPAEATAREATKDSVEERSFIILDSEPHLADVGRLNKEGDSGETVPDDPVEHEAQKITSPEGKKSPGKTKGKTSPIDLQETLDYPVKTEKIPLDDSIAAEYADLDLPVFTSAIDTLDISDDSDSSSSSDVSRKTTLTTGPYQTPRHRARSSSEKESAESETKSPPDDSSDKEIVDITDSPDEHDATEDFKVESQTEMTEDTDTSSSKLTKDSMEHKSSETEEEQILPVPEIPKEQEEPLPSTSSQVKGFEEFVDIQPILKFEKGITKSIKNGKGIKSVLEAAVPSVLKFKRALKKGVSTVSDSKLERTGSLKTEETVKPKEQESTLSSIKKEKSPESKKEKTSDQKKVTAIEKRQSFKQRVQKPSTDQNKRKSGEQEDSRAQDPNKSRDPSQEKRSEKATDRSRRYSDQEKQKQNEERRRRQSDQSQISRKPVEEPRKSTEELIRKSSIPKSKPETVKKSSSSEKSISPPKPEIDLRKAQPKYMAWYKKNQEEMEKRRGELKASSEEDEQLPKWLRRRMRRSKAAKAEKKKADEKTPEITPRAKRKVKPLVNVESEQLKAIVRQGRKLRRAEGGANEDPPVQIFASSPPETAPAPEPHRHHLVQHSEYKYEKIPPPFYLHPPPAPHPSPQLSPEHFEARGECRHHEEDFDAGVAMPMQGRLRHQQLLEKKSVFDIAYSEAAPSQLRPDSTTPPS